MAVSGADNGRTLTRWKKKAGKEGILRMCDHEVNQKISIPGREKPDDIANFEMIDLNTPLYGSRES